ncbi:hypothetical protein SLS58_007408 [Diplodia intermedia]|uniref:Uncharacterized protein n=1 Tax=Diplodia intermedia TaxID=856260 RepID=A0ABR3TKQ8_9PEZI
MPPAVPLPSTPPRPIAPNIVLQPPLSRRGTGPGLVLVVGAHLPLGGGDATLDPPPLLKWAEEGFAVVQVMVRDAYVPLPTPAYKTLNAATNPRIAAIINYSATPVPAAATSIPTLWHAPDQTPAPTADTTTITHVYPAAPPNFTLPAHPSYRSGPAALAHTRSLAFIKPLVGGPSFDLEAIWNEHCAYEFGERAVDKTMATMVQEPYVNHIPTVTGGVGRERLTHFYRNHFVHSNPPDTSLELVSRTVGIDRVIDEFVFRCTHDRVVDWL